MNKTELIDKVWASLGHRFTKGELFLLVDEIFNQISNEIVKNKPVKIHNFGNFSLYRLKATKKKLPGRQVTVNVPSRYKLKFSPSTGLAKKLLKP